MSSRSSLAHSFPGKSRKLNPRQQSYKTSLKCFFFVYQKFQIFWVGLMYVRNSPTPSSVSCHAWQPLTSFRHLSVTCVFGKCSKTHLPRTCLSLTERYFKHVYGSQNAIRLSLSSRHVTYLHYHYSGGVSTPPLPGHYVQQHISTPTPTPRHSATSQTTLVIPPDSLHLVRQSSSAFVLN